MRHFLEAPIHGPEFPGSWFRAYCDCLYVPTRVTRLAFCNGRGNMSNLQLEHHKKTQEHRLSSKLSRCREYHSENATARWVIPGCDGASYTCPIDRGRPTATVEKHRYCDIKFPYHGNATEKQGASKVLIFGLRVENAGPMSKNLLRLTIGNEHFRSRFQTSGRIKHENSQKDGIRSGI